MEMEGSSCVKSHKQNIDIIVITIKETWLESTCNECKWPENTDTSRDTEILTESLQEKKHIYVGLREK